MEQIPNIQYVNGVKTLMVDGKPFLALSGELHNSSASSTEYMREIVWPNLRKVGVNSVIATVSWEQIEPSEGKFDFSTVDDIIADARAEEIRLILIWFGLWKNGESHYVPDWVKRNPDTYTLCRLAHATKLQSPFAPQYAYTISPLCKAAVDADARAYRALMAHIAQVDTDHTVIMMQVENEIGLIGSSRDYSAEATALFESEVPAPLAAALDISGTWRDAFGDDGEEFFMAWHYGCAVQTILSAGAAELPLPMYVNAWLRQDPDRAGTYPSGGPMMHAHHIWSVAAPGIAFYTPDLYVPDFDAVCKEYTQHGNPLFIPETRINVSSAASIFLAVGQYDAIGFCPFGIEDVPNGGSGGPPPEELAALNIDFSAFDAFGADVYLPQSYALLSGMTGLLHEHRGRNSMVGFYQYGADSGCVLQFECYDIRINYGRRAAGKPPAGGLVIALDRDTFVFAGTNFRAEILPKKHEESFASILRLEEGQFRDSVWHRRRILNGDERNIKIGHQPQAVKVECFKFSVK